MKAIKGDIKYAKHFFTRLKGYMWEQEPTHFQVLVFTHCRQVHTFNMHFSLDILYLSKSFEVLCAFKNVARGIVLPRHPKAYYIAETAAGGFENIAVGDVVEFIQAE